MGRMNIAVYLIIAGVVVFVLNYLHISVSYMKFIFGLLLLLGGAQMILSSLSLPSLASNSEHHALFLNAKFHYPNSAGSKIFYTYFAKSYLDLSQIDISRGDIDLTINNTLGETQILINPEIPLEIRVASGLLSVIHGPNGDRLLSHTTKKYAPATVESRPSKLIVNLNGYLSSIMFAKAQSAYKRK
jgi:hypothetical protein